MEEFFLDGTKLWILFSFIVFTIGAYKMGKDAVVKNLDTRIEDIRKNLESSETLRVEAQELLAQYQRKHKDAVNEAEKIVQKAEKQAEEIRAAAERELNETIERRESQLEERIERMQQSAVEEIRTYAAELALNATAEIVADKLNKATNSKIVDQSIKEIGEHIH